MHAIDHNALVMIPVLVFYSVQIMLFFCRRTGSDRYKIVHRGKYPVRRCQARSACPTSEAPAHLSHPALREHAHTERSDFFSLGNSKCDTQQITKQGDIPPPHRFLDYRSLRLAHLAVSGRAGWGLVCQITTDISPCHHGRRSRTRISTTHGMRTALSAQERGSPSRSRMDTSTGVQMALPS